VALAPADTPDLMPDAFPETFPTRGRKIEPSWLHHHPR
jgi:hypothetical protein